MKLLSIAIMFAALPARAQPAPPPGAESGRVDEPSDGDTTARKVGRTLLFVPRGVLEAGMMPIRGTLWANDRYRLADRIRAWFFNESGTIGLYPLAFFDTSEGVLVGLQFQWAINPNNRLKVFAGAGPSRRHFDTSFRSTGHFNGRLALGFYGEYDVKPESRFYGVGNGDEISAPAMPLDPFTEDAATESFYEDRLARAATIADVRISRAIYLSAAGAIAERKHDASSRTPSIEQVFDVDQLVAFDRYRSGYGELELRYDTRGPSSLWQPAMLTSQGSLAAAYGGPALVDEGTTFWRYGVDLQHYLTLANGPRVLAARFELEGISADADEVPFTELPALGGHTWLRGYPTDRFRDRVAAVGTLEYQWDLSRILYMSVFADAGRVYPALDELTLEDMRVGYGIALEGHSQSSLVARVSMSSSIDGGLFFHLYLDPVSEIEPRVRRR
jgi:hypothetical protein